MWDSTQLFPESDLRLNYELCKMFSEKLDANNVHVVLSAAGRVGNKSQLQRLGNNLMRELWTFYQNRDAM